MNQVTLSSVLGNGQRLDGGAMFGNAPRALWEQWYTPDKLGRIGLNCRCMLIQCEGKNILVETGIGAFMKPELAERYGVIESEKHQLLENLHQKYHLSHEQIDYVVLSHLHFDHAGGLLPTYNQIKNGNDSILFPNAQYIVGKEAFERAQSPHLRDKASFIPDLQAKLMKSGRLSLVDGPRLSGFFDNRARFMYSHGHTPGQMHLIFQGDDTAVVFAGDLVPGIAWLHLPMSMGYDRFPERLIDEKQSLYDTVEEKDWLLFYTHDPNVACSKISKNEKGRYIPSDEMQTLNHWKI